MGGGGGGGCGIFFFWSAASNTLHRVELTAQTTGTLKICTPSLTKTSLCPSAETEGLCEKSPFISTSMLFEDKTWRDRA